MSNFVRRLVSGDKARFKDKNLDMELDLVYVTDNIIIMGFPATGVEGLYRNRREDARKFLDHRHGKNYWVFNFCPLRENSYPSSFFGGRVSRYPFPDHHAPPLAILPLFVREAREWLFGSPDRVAVLHCKAGKGRSGTLACAYLLALDETPSPPQLQRNMNNKEWAKQRADQVMETVETEEMNDGAQTIEDPRVAEKEEEGFNATAQTSSEKLELKQKLTAEMQDENRVPSITGKPASETPANLTPTSGSVADDIGTIDTKAKPNSRLNTLEDVLALHTVRRMRSPSSPDKKLKQGVSIPSQRRWLYYWSQLLANAAPHDFWQAPLPRVRLREMRVRIRNLGGLKMNLLKIANQLIEKTNATKYGVQERGRGPVWVSLARYDDELVEMLENCERLTRLEDGDMGKRRRESEDTLREIFMDDKWDKGKMIRSFSRLGHLNSVSDTELSEDGNVASHRLRPLTDQKWEALQEEMPEPAAKFSLEKETQQPLATTESPAADSAPSTASSVTDFAQAVDNTKAEKGVILDSAREVRAKIYMGQVFMGWFWFIPAFHMPPPPPSSSISHGQPPPTTTANFTLVRKEIDFPIGAGSALIDVDVALEWVVPGLDPAADRRDPPRTQTSKDSAEGDGGEPGAGRGGIVAGIQAAISDASGREAVEVIEASDQ